MAHTFTAHHASEKSVKIGIAAAHTTQWPKYDWVETALRNLGHDVRRATEARELAKLDAECELVILGQKSLAGRWPNIRDTASRKRATWAYWWFDLVAEDANRPLAEQGFIRQFDPQFRVCDYVFVKERGLLSEYRKLGINAFWLDQGCPSDYPAVDESAEKLWDVLVWGQSRGYPQRVKEVEDLVAAGYTVAWAGAKRVPAGVKQLQWTHPDKFPELASHALCVLNVGKRNDLEGYWSDTLWLALGAGVPVLTRSAPQNPYTRMPEDISEVIEEQYPAEEARQWVRTNHACENRCRQLISTVQKGVLTAAVAG